MAIRRGWISLLTFSSLLVLMSVLVFGTNMGIAPVVAQSVGTHGIGFAKGCDSPVNVGDPYNCGFLIANTILLDTHRDTLTVDSLTDVVHAFNGDIPSGELLPTRTIAAYSDGATCVTAANVFVPVGGQARCCAPCRQAARWPSRGRRCTPCRQATWAATAR
jgi:hypothetical protein